MVRYIVSILIIFVSSCLKENELGLKKITNNSNKIVLHGYYLYENSLGIFPIVLYGNGVILKLPSYNIRDSFRIKQDILDPVFLKKIKSWQYSWGVYKIDSLRISIERWYPGEKPYNTYLETGEILNDTSFRITIFSNPDGSDPEIRNDLYRFIEFSPKPDSTNVFIK